MNPAKTSYHSDYVYFYRTKCYYLICSSDNIFYYKANLLPLHWILNFMKMKKLFLLFMVIALTGAFSTINAQTKSTLSDKELSAQYKREIDVLNSEIKTIKLKLKTDKESSELKKELSAKQLKLDEAKSNKKIIDNAIKSKAASEKAAMKAEKAQRDAEKQAAEAQRLKNKEN